MHKRFPSSHSMSKLMLGVGVCFCLVVVLPQVSAKVRSCDRRSDAKICGSDSNSNGILKLFLYSHCRQCQWRCSWDIMKHSKNSSSSFIKTGSDQWTNSGSISFKHILIKTNFRSMRNSGKHGMNRWRSLSPICRRKWAHFKTWRISILQMFHFHLHLFHIPNLLRVAFQLCLQLCLQLHLHWFPHLYRLYLSYPTPPLSLQDPVLKAVNLLKHQGQLYFPLLVPMHQKYLVHLCIQLTILKEVHPSALQTMESLKFTIINKLSKDVGNWKPLLHCLQHTHLPCRINQWDQVDCFQILPDQHVSKAPEVLGKDTFIDWYVWGWMRFGDILRNETLSYSQIFLRSYEVCLAEVLCMHVMVCIYLITAKISKFCSPNHFLKWNTFFSSCFSSEMLQHAAPF